MPRHKRIASETGFYHWINRGINQKKIFHKAGDFRCWLKLVEEHRSDYGVRLHHFCLMSNHIHLLLSCGEIRDLSRFSCMIQRRYAYYYCKTYQWHGQVFQRMFKSLPIENDSYLLECGRYIERNPVRAHLAKRPEDYLFSSFRHYAYGEELKCLEPSPAYLALGQTPVNRRERYQSYVSSERPYDKILDRVLEG